MATKTLFVTIFLSLISVLFIACGQGPPSPAADSKTPVPAKDTSPKTGWEQKWSNLLADAKKEGDVLIYTNLNPQAKTLLSEAFKGKYGITVDYLALSSGAEVVARAMSEKRAGIYAADIFIAGTTAFLPKPEGLLAPIEPLLILPEVLDPKVWRGRESLAFADKEKQIFDLIASVWGSLLVNTELIKEGEITSYLDVLKPTYKGKITLYDPSIAGSSNSLFTHLAKNIWSLDQSIDFLRQLMKQEPAVTRDPRVQTEWVARGKYPVALGPSSRDVATFLDLNAPIGLVWTKEGAYTSSVGGALGVPVRSPHSKAATLFVNWLLTKEGQTIFSRGFGHPPTRLDVPPEVNPKILPPADLKIFISSEEYLSLQGKIMQLAREAMAPGK